MTDNLRTRIAAVVHQYSVPPSMAELVADAVIRELNADCVYRYACHHCGDFWFDKSERMQRFALLHGKSHR